MRRGCAVFVVLVALVLLAWILTGPALWPR